MRPSVTLKNGQVRTHSERLQFMSSAERKQYETVLASKEADLASRLGTRDGIVIEDADANVADAAAWISTQMTPAPKTCTVCDQVWEDYIQAVTAHLKIVARR